MDGHKVEIIYRDTTGPNPEVSRRAAQELVSVEKVDFLAGFGLSPNAVGAAPIATASKTPMIIMNAAATSSIVMRSPYIVRASFTLPQVSAPLAAWAAENDIKTVYTLVSDYGPGLDSEKAFIKAFEAAGGKVLGSVRAPMANPEFGPYLQRASDAKPDAIFAFVPSGDTGVQLLKAYEQRGLKDQGIQLITTGDITDDVFLDRIGDVALGLVTSHHYSMAHDSPENKELIKAYQDVHGPDARVNFYMAATWDGMNMMYDIIRELDGNIDGDKAVELAKNMKITSPRGPIEFDTIPMVKDPGKEE